MFLKLLELWGAACVGAGLGWIACALLTGRRGRQDQYADVLRGWISPPEIEVREKPAAKWRMN